MHTNYNEQTKALGTVAAHLVTTLYSRNHTVFHFHEAEEILGGRDSASKALTQLISNGVVQD